MTNLPIRETRRSLKPKELKKVRPNVTLHENMIMIRTGTFRFFVVVAFTHTIIIIIVLLEDHPPQKGLLLFEFDDSSKAIQPPKEDI